jgi:hypothetical protein
MQEEQFKRAKDAMQEELRQSESEQSLLTNDFTVIEEEINN